MADYNNDPQLLDELLHLRAENASFFREIQGLKELNDFMRQIINTLITK